MARQILPDDRQKDSILNQIEEGMDVYSFDNEHVGEVERIFFGSVDEEEERTGAGAATPDDPRMRNRSWVEDFAEAFRTDEIPDEMRERLLRRGFIRIDADGLFAGDKYALPDQIDRVTDDGVILKASKDELFS